jgi:tetratricopeptide (TPR) repeat protein
MTETMVQKEETSGDDLLWGAILVLAVLLAYQSVWGAGFVWDDGPIITANPSVIGPLGFKEIWTTSAADICPLVISTFHVEYLLWGLKPLPFHLVTVCFHAASAVILWRVLRRLIGQGAWLGAAIWALHPVNVESVAWISETKNTESGLFFLLSILFFLRWMKAQEAGGGSRSSWPYRWMLIFSALAMASKSSTVILPVVMGLCAWWMEGRLSARTATRLAPVFLLSVAAGAASLWTENLQLASIHDPQWARSWPERFAAAGDAVWFYLGKLLWPHPLIANYPRWQIDAGRWTSYLGLIAVIFALGFLWRGRQSQFRPVFFAFAYFVIALLPGLGLVDSGIFIYSLVFDHFQYLASMGPLALASAGIVRLANRAMPDRLSLQSALCGGFLVVLGLLSWSRASVFTSEESLWTDTLAKNPDCWEAYNNLGYALLNKGQLDKAATLFQKSLAINSRNWMAHTNFGSTLAQQGKSDDAMAENRKALAINPSDFEAHNNLGIGLMQKGKVNEALAEYQKAVALNPYDAQAHNDLGSADLAIGRPYDAIAEFRAALDLKPDDVEAQNNLGWALANRGETDEAVGYLRKAAATYPDVAQVHFNLGFALFKKEEYDEAIHEFQAALKINPDYADALYYLGSALARKGDTDEAIIHLRDAEQKMPGFIGVHYDMGSALMQAGRIDEAIEQFDKVVEINPKFADAHTELGIALARKGEQAKAIDQFEEVVRLQPDKAEAKKNLDKAKELASKSAKAK